MKSILEDLEEQVKVKVRGRVLFQRVLGHKTIHIENSSIEGRTVCKLKVGGHKLYSRMEPDEEYDPAKVCLTCLRPLSDTRPESDVEEQYEKLDAECFEREEAENIEGAVQMLMDASASERPHALASGEDSEELSPIGINYRVSKHRSPLRGGSLPGWSKINHLRFLLGLKQVVAESALRGQFCLKCLFASLFCISVLCGFRLP